MRQNIARRSRLLVAGALLGVALAAFVAPGAASAGDAGDAGRAPGKASFSYSCLQALTVCREAGIEAGSSPESVARYLEKRATSGNTTFVGYGYLTNYGNNSRYYGWKLDRNVAGLRLNYYHCQVVNGVLTNCVLKGELFVQASFVFNGHLVTNITGNVTNATSVSLEVRHGVICRTPSVDCRSEAAPYRSLIGAGGGTNSFRFVPQYLRGPDSYDMMFAWEIYDPGLNSYAYTPGFDSIDFWCESFISTDNPGECFFPA